MLMLRLQRLGKNKQPSYRLVVSDKRHDTQYIATEILGHFNPLAKPEPVVNFKMDRVKYWLSVGAQPSATVHNILVKAGVVQGKKAKSVYLSKTRKKKLEAKKPKAETAPAAEAPAA